MDGGFQKPSGYASLLARDLDASSATRGIVAAFLRYHGFVLQDPDAKELEGYFTGTDLYSVTLTSKGLKLYIKAKVRSDSPAYSAVLTKILYPKDIGSNYIFAITKPAERD
jgi:hypothetical protein